MMELKPIICKERPYEHNVTPLCWLCGYNYGILELQENEESTSHAYICKQCWYGIRLADGIHPVVAGD